MARPSTYLKIEQERGQEMSLILLDYLEVKGLSLEDTGEQLGVSEGTVWEWAHRAGLRYECHWVPSPARSPTLGTSREARRR